MTIHAPGSQPHPQARRRSLESRGLHFIEHHQPLIWSLIAAASVLVVVLRP